MLSTTIRYNPPNLMQAISDAPRSVRGPMTEAAARYLVGDGTRGLSHYPAYRFVSRTSAYGRPFQTDKQRRWFFAALRNGEILPGYPRRTGRLQRGWTISYDGVKTRITNAEPHAPFVMGEGTQSRHEELVGWRVVPQIAATNENGMIQAAERSVQETLRAMGL